MVWFDNGGEMIRLGPSCHEEPNGNNFYSQQTSCFKELFNFVPASATKKASTTSNGDEVDHRYDASVGAEADALAERKDQPNEADVIKRRCEN